LKKRRVSSGREGGWGVLLWLALTILIGKDIFLAKEPKYEDLTSYISILDDCRIYHQTDKKGFTEKTPHILLAMRSTCPITGPRIKSVSTFEMWAPKGQSPEDVCNGVMSYKGQRLKIYYLKNPDYLEVASLAGEAPLWQVDFLGTPIVTYASQIEAWRHRIRQEKFWFFMVFCVPAALMAIGYFLKIRSFGYS